MRLLSTIAAVALLTVGAFAQADNKTSGYLAASVSTTNGDGGYAPNTYPSIEGGIAKGNHTFGLALGARDLTFDDSGASNYFVEVKTAAYAKMADSKVKPYLVFGGGTYFDTDHLFIEYGGGLAYPLCSRSDFSVGASNWDGSNYLSLGVSLSL